MSEPQSHSISEAGVRSVPRIAISVRVQSRSLPDFFATTLDLAQNGMQLQISEPLVVGDDLDFSLHLPNRKKVSGRGRVRWSSRAKPSRAGIEFLELPYEQGCELHHFLRERPQKTIEPDSQLAGEEQTKLHHQLELEVQLVEAIQQEEALVITLLEEEEPVQWLFPNPTRIQGQIQRDVLGSLQVRPRDSERFEFSFLGPGRRPILKFNSQMPERSAG